MMSLGWYIRAELRKLVGWSVLSGEGTPPTYRYITEHGAGQVCLGQADWRTAPVQVFRWKVRHPFTSFSSPKLQS